MIISKCFDVEVLPNFFSIIFVDLSNYLEVFKDCVDEKGNPVPLTEKYSVKEIISKLNTIKSDSFWISDTNDDQLLELVSYINKMEAKYETKISDLGEVYQIPIRYDLFGFNNIGYDDYMVKAFLMYFNRFDTTKQLLTFLYNTSKEIIRLQKDKQMFYQDKTMQLIKSYKLPYASVDVQQIYGLHSAGVNINSETGERVKFGKSLKQTSINLKWYELLEFNLPPITEEEANLYYRKSDVYRGMTTDKLDKLISNFNRCIMPQYIPDMMHYNKNDVFIVAEMVRQKPDEVKLRYSITSAFGVNVLSSARANIADKLTVKFYSDMSGLHKDKFIKLRTERTRLSFNKIIFPHIKFKTKQLKDLLEDMKKVSIYKTNKDAFCREVRFYGTTYTLATGGIHSSDPPRILKSTNDYTYIHWDYTSYYPSIMISYYVCPKHLNTKAFIKMLSYLKDTRVKCKHGGDVNIIEGVPNKVAAEALKIVINSIYGKLGSELFFLYDRFAQMQVTINGQLMTMSLIEDLELAGIHVVSANTDGIVLKLPNNKKEEFKQITDAWNKNNKMSADGEEYKIIVSRDVNNYFDIQKDGSVEYKGALDPKQYIKDLKKGYDMPIVAKAVYNYFIYDIPVMDTLHSCKDILDFCKTQNVGNQWNVAYDTVENNKVISKQIQTKVRFYVSKKGVTLYKYSSDGRKNRLAAGLSVSILNTLDDKPIEDRNIDYSYYYQECYKIIDPIKLSISPNQKSGKTLIKRKSHFYNTLFDMEELM